MRKRRKQASWFLGLLWAALLLAGCGAGVSETETVMESSQEERIGAAVEKENQEEHLSDNERIYGEDDDTSVVTMYMTIRSGNAEDHTNHTWSEINSLDNYYYSDNDIPRYNCDVILQIGDENGPVEGELGYGETIPNAVVQIRGQTSSRREQKNYKVRIKEGKGEWRGQRTIALNKHVGDPSRFRNKMAYDLMKAVPEMISARTQFVHLYVKDETAGGNGEFTDYGLFTQVEQMNKTYLKNHGLDNKGHLYKINFFEWYQYDAIRLASDPEYNVKAFEEYIEIKGNDNHAKMLETLAAIQDYSISTQELIETYFDSENICYWMAFQILIGNYDVGSRNYYVYSPLNSQKWYFISWDNDAAFSRTEQRLNNHSEGMSWERGMTQFLHISLFERMFKEKEYREQLMRAADDLRKNYLNREIMSRKVAAYREVVKNYIFSPPDIQYIRVSQEEFDTITLALPAEIDENYGYLQESMVKPWPFFVGTPYEDDGKIEVEWDVAYEVNHEEITYTAIIATDYFYENVVEKQEGLVIPEASFQMLPPGEYYLKVIARNESGYEQECYDYYSRSDGGGKAYGTVAFTVHGDGEITLMEKTRV